MLIALKHISRMDPLNRGTHHKQFQHFINESYTNLLSDFCTIFSDYGTPKRLEAVQKRMRKDFESMLKSNETNSLLKWLEKNKGHRFADSLYLKDRSFDENLVLFHRDLFDAMHSYLMHGYDIGLRIRVQRLMTRTEDIPKISRSQGDVHIPDLHEYSHIVPAVNLKMMKYKDPSFDFVQMIYAGTNRVYVFAKNDCISRSESLVGVIDATLREYVFYLGETNQFIDDDGRSEFVKWILRNEITEIELKAALDGATDYVDLPIGDIAAHFPLDGNYPSTDERNHAIFRVIQRCYRYQFKYIEALEYQSKSWRPSNQRLDAALKRLLTATECFVKLHKLRHDDRVQILCDFIDFHYESFLSDWMKVSNHYKNKKRLNRLINQMNTDANGESRRWPHDPASCAHVRDPQQLLDDIEDINDRGDFLLLLMDALLSLVHGHGVEIQFAAIKDVLTAEELDDTRVLWDLVMNPLRRIKEIMLGKEKVLVFIYVK